MDENHFQIELQFQQNAYEYEKRDGKQPQGLFLLNRAITAIETTQLQTFRYLHYVSSDSYPKQKDYLFLKAFESEIVIWGNLEKLLMNEYRRLIEDFEKHNYPPYRYGGYPPHEPLERNSKLDLNYLRRSTILLVYSFISGWLDLNELSINEREYLIKELQRFRFMARNSKPETIKIVGAQQLSPAIVILSVFGTIGLTFSLILLSVWLGNYVRHSEIDIRNKEIALEASEIILEKLKDKNIDVRPEAVEELIKNAKIKSIDFPSLASIKVGIK